MIDGVMTLTIVVSTTTRDTPRAIAIRPSHFRAAALCAIPTPNFILKLFDFQVTP